MKVLNTERLRIRPVMERDWPQIKAIWEDFQTSPFAQYDRPFDTDDAFVQDRVAKWAKANEGTEHMFFAVCLHDAVIGYAAFNIREMGYEIGYCFHSAFHGKGYAKESIAALMDYLQEMGVTRLTAGTAMGNVPSVRLLKSLGFRQTETEDVSFYQDADGKAIVFEGGIFEKIMG